VLEVRLQSASRIKFAALERSTEAAMKAQATLFILSAVTELQIQQWIHEYGWLLVFVWLFVLGLALNLTPCVYPMVPITVAYFAGQRERKGMVAARAVAYVLGIAITYSALGVVAALAGRMFGAQLQNPWVLSGIALLLVALALSQFGFYQIRPPSFLLQRVGVSAGASLLAALSMGLVVGLVAAPCLAPVTLALLLFVGASGNPWLGFSMFFVLALGLGAPYVALAMLSGMLNNLPKSGAWMVWLERLLGFVLLGLALYFVATLLPARVVRWAVFLLAASAGVYLGWLESSSTGGRAFPWLKKIVGVACLAVAAVALVPSRLPAQQIAWQPYDAAVVEQAERDGQPVILDFYADWCPPCQEMERTTYVDPRVVDASQAFLMVKVDLTHDTPEGDRLMEKYNVQGVPTLVFLDRQGREIKQQRVTDYVGPEEFLGKLQDVLREG
jgi:thiol:disulfide interchange protein DsbD